MEPTAGFAGRLRELWYAYQARLRRKVEQKELAALVADFLGREPLAQATVSKWMLGKAIPDLDTVCAIAVVLEGDPATLAFGEWRDPEVARKGAGAVRALATVRRDQEAIRRAEAGRGRTQKRPGRKRG